jgi:hypothetical protein
MPRWARVPRLHPISVRFGDARTADELRGGTGDTPAERITGNLERAVAELGRRT